MDLLSDRIIIIEFKYPNSRRKAEKAEEKSARDVRLEKGCRKRCRVMVAD